MKVEAGGTEDDEELRFAEKVANFVCEKGEATRLEVDIRFGLSKITSNRLLYIAADKGWIRKSDKRGSRGAAVWIPGNPPADFDTAGPSAVRG